MYQCCIEVSGAHNLPRQCHQDSAVRRRIRVHAGCKCDRHCITSLHRVRSLKIRLFGHLDGREQLIIKAITASKAPALPVFSQTSAKGTLLGPNIRLPRTGVVFPFSALPKVQQTNRFDIILQYLVLGRQAVIIIYETLRNNSADASAFKTSNLLH